MGEYDGNYVTLDSVRRTSGIGSEINDTDVKAIIDECEPQIERFYNTKFTPKETIEIQDGNGTPRLILLKNPVLAVRELKIDGDTEDPANLYVSRGSGKIELTDDATVSTFKTGSRIVRIKYIYGDLEESSTETTTGAASVAGTSVELTVSDETGFEDGDWIEVYGMDGNRECAEVTATDTGKITVDQLVFAHESGSKVIKLQVKEIMKKLMNIACAIALVARIVGQSYTDTVGYGLGELSVQKGEPYTQWRETATQLIRERDLIMGAIRPRPCIM
jgi:uncharacterized protein YqfB (UPF0267 family)